jgi:hypothetical protein
MSEPRWVRFDSLSWRGPGRWVRCASLILTGILIGAACAQSPSEDRLPAEAAAPRSLWVTLTQGDGGHARLGSEVIPLGLWSEAPLSVLSGD